MIATTGDEWGRRRADVEARVRAGRVRGRALGELCRVQIGRVPGLVFLAGALVAATSNSSGGMGAMGVVAGVVLIAASCSVAAAWNDLADVESDRVNGRLDRPLVAGTLQRRDVTRVVVAGTVVVGVAQLALPQPSGLVVTAVAGAIAATYALEPIALQRRGLLGLVVLAFGYLVLPIGLALGLPAILPAAPLALLGAGSLAHKDVRDELGDRAAGKRTVLVRHGYRRMASIAVGVALIGCIGLGATVGVGWWCVSAALACVSLGWMLVRGHQERIWVASRLAVLVTAVLIAVDLAI